MTHSLDSPTRQRVREEYVREASGAPDVLGHLVGNHQRFRRRWPRWDDRVEFRVRRSVGAGDLLCCTPLIAALRAASPDRRLVFETLHPEVLIGNPHLDDIRDNWAVSEPADLDLDGACEKDALAPHGPWHPLGDERGATHLIDTFAVHAGVELTQGRGLWLRLSRLEREWAARATAALGPGGYIAINTHSSWRIRDWPGWDAVVAAVTGAGGRVVLLGRGADAALPPLGPGVPWRRISPPSRMAGLIEAPVTGGKGPPPPMMGECLAAVASGSVLDLRGLTRARQAFAVVAGARAFLGPDSGLAHVSGAFGVPGVVIGGAVRIALRLHSGQVGLDTPLSCGGCYHRSVFGHDNQPERCHREEEGEPRPSYGAACMTAISPMSVLDALDALMGGAFGRGENCHG